MSSDPFFSVAQGIYGGGRGFGYADYQQLYCEVADTIHSSHPSADVSAAAVCHAKVAQRILPPHRVLLIFAAHS